MTSDEEEEKEQQQTPSSRSSGQKERQQEALYGPRGRADHKPGQMITFASADTGYKELIGEVLYVRAPGPAIVGGRSHPTAYIVFVQGEAFPRVVYPSDIVIRGGEPQEP